MNNQRKGVIMRLFRITFIALFATFITAHAAVVMGADLPKASITPDHILKGTNPTVTLTLDKGITNQDKLRARVGVQVVPVQKQEADGKLTVQLPKLDLMGSADVELIGEDDKPVATGKLNYVESAEQSFNRFWFLLLYVLLIVSPPTVMTFYDIVKSYKERTTVFEKLTKGKNINPDEIPALLVAMDQGPSGLTGLTRGLITVTIILVLAIAVFHLIVFAPSDIPPIAQQLLTLLAGTLTAITGFYFGSKANTQPTQPTQSGDGKTEVSVKPTIKEFDPPVEVVAKEKLTVKGSGFGGQQGKGEVMFNEKKAEQATEWTDNSITVTVPDGLPEEQSVNVVVKNSNGVSSDPKPIKVK
ncbi:MAG: hypothetical protein HKK66_07120 [Chlorobiaceae bacterium]|nr:hypothetical protein [Chlorobiaceae bacterium]